jgi:hypothetical protein
MRSTKIRKLPIPARGEKQNAHQIRQPRAQDLHRLAHEIANQLTVINLSCFRIRGNAAKALPASSLRNLERVERAIAEITAFVETLRRVDDQPEGTPQAAPSPQTTNVYPLFEPA